MINDLKDGVHYNIPHNEYLKFNGLTNSGVKDLNVSELDFWAKKHGWVDQSESDALSFGTMAHVALLEGWDRFSDDYMIKPAGMRFSTKEGKAWREENSGCLHCKAADHLKVQRLNQVIQAVPNYKKFFENGSPEVTLIWTETYKGRSIRCAARADYFGQEGITDLKTFTNQMSKPLAVAVALNFSNYKYFTQGYWYLRGLNALKKKGFCDNVPNKFTFAFTQSDGVPNVIFREFAKHTNGMENAYFRLGRQFCERAIMIYDNCMQIFGWDTPWILENQERAFIDDEMPKYLFND